jgi:L-arabinonolactonase
VDAQGGYWLAVVGSGSVRRYRPDGSLDETISLPCSNPTKPAFGGTDMQTMYITTTKTVIKSDAPGAATNGGLFFTRSGFTGISDAVFIG